MQLKYLLFLYLLEIEGLQGVRVKPDSQIILMDGVLVNVSQYAATVMIVRVLQAKLSASENLFCRQRTIKTFYHLGCVCYRKHSTLLLLYRIQTQVHQEVR